MGLGNWLYQRISKFLMKDVARRRAYLCDFSRVTQEIRPGDVLLVESRNRISRIIKRITQSPWTHAALYVGRLHDIENPRVRACAAANYKGNISDQLIIESMLGKGNYLANINLYEQDHVRICRPSGISHHDVQRIIAYAMDHLGADYNVRHFLDLGRFLMGSHFIPKRWKSSLFSTDPNQTTQDICSALIAKAFISVQFPILPLVRQKRGHKLEFIHRNCKLFAPCDFDYSPYFNIIKYPIYPVADSAPYRNLPWNETLMSNDDIGISDIAEEDEHNDGFDRSNTD